MDLCNFVAVIENRMERILAGTKEVPVFEGKKAAYFTLGCKLNFAETSTIGRLLEQAGVRTARQGECADICVVNTCSVTEVADHK